MKYKDTAIFSDLDGTLLTSDTKVHPLNRHAINYYIKEGGKFCFSTGRTHLNTKELLKNIATNGPSIFYNGSICCDLNTNNILFRNELNKKHVYSFLSIILKKYQEINIVIHTEEYSAFVTNKINANKVFVEEHQPLIYKSIDLVIEPWLKILFCVPVEQMNAFEKEAKMELGKEVETVVSASTYLELLPKGTSKGSALAKISKDKAFEGRKIIAIGDYNNDIELLIHSNIPVAPENALKSIKEIAKYHVKNNNEGAIADLIYRVIPMIEY